MSMMQRWARFIGRTPWVWIALWPIAALGIWLPAPRVPTLLADDDTGFIPAEMPSRRAFARLRTEFPSHAPASRAVVVFFRETGLKREDHALIADLAATVSARSEELNWNVRAAPLTPHLKRLLESPDGKAAVIAVDLPAELLTHSTVNRVTDIKRVIAGRSTPPGLEIHVTGNGALGELLNANTKHDVDQTTLWAFAGVTVILLIIYRSPVAMLLPLVTIALSLMVALGLLGWAAAAGWPINGLVEMFIIVILVGSGVDYCLFLFARFREEMSQIPEVGRAVEVAVRRTGGAILASAGTNAVGLATLALGHNRNLHTSGPTIALAICVATVAVLSLTPSLIRVVGRHLVWPGKLPTADRHRSELWDMVARLATRRPGVVCLAVVGALVGPAFLGTRVKPLYDSYEEYPAGSSLVRGAFLYEQHFFQSTGISEQTLIISADARLDAPKVLPALRRAVDTFAVALATEFTVVYQRDVQDPLGQDRPAASTNAKSPIDVVAAGLRERLARRYYIGESGRASRVDFAIRAEPRAGETLESLPHLRTLATQAVLQSGLAEACGGSLCRHPRLAHPRLPRHRRRCDYPHLSYSRSLDSIPGPGGHPDRGYLVHLPGRLWRHLAHLPSVLRGEQCQLRAQLPIVHHRPGLGARLQYLRGNAHPRGVEGESAA